MTIKWVLDTYVMRTVASLELYVMRTVASLELYSIADFGVDVVKIFVPADLGICKQWCIIINIYVSLGSFLLSYK